MSKDCPNEKKLVCRNCDEEGHLSRECPKPRDCKWSSPLALIDADNV